jgi:hypothetical protein
MAAEAEVEAAAAQTLSKRANGSGVVVYGIDTVSICTTVHLGFD